jgi:hypothetical protein
MCIIPRNNEPLVQKKSKMYGGKNNEKSIVGKYDVSNLLY